MIERQMITIAAESLEALHGHIAAAASEQLAAPRRSEPPPLRLEPTQAHSLFALRQRCGCGHAVCPALPPPAACAPAAAAGGSATPSALPPPPLLELRCSSLDGRYPTADTRRTLSERLLNLVPPPLDLSAVARARSKRHARTASDEAVLLHDGWTAPKAPRHQPAVAASAPAHSMDSASADCALPPGDEVPAGLLPGGVIPGWLSKQELEEALMPQGGEFAGCTGLDDDDEDEEAERGGGSHSGGMRRRSCTSPPRAPLRRSLASTHLLNSRW